MQYRKLGTTEIDVSLICLGTMTWGQQNTEEQAHEQLDYALAHGVNFIDTAEMYPVPPTAETQGLTEAYIGTWLASRQCRDKVILASKVVGRSTNFPYLRPEMDKGETRLDRKHIMTALEASLKRLQTDYLDLYQLHWPERLTNYFGELGYTHSKTDTDHIPLEETLDVLQECVKAGKIRHVGLSNENPWGIMHSLRLAEEKGLPRMQSVQNPYSLLNRAYEVGSAEVSIREQCGLLAYSPLAFGVLSGKYLDDPNAKGRVTWHPRFKRYSNAQAEQATREYVAIARAAGLDPAQMALAFINQQPFVTSNIIGATTMAQLRSNIASAQVQLQGEVMAKINEVHSRISNPCP